MWLGHLKSQVRNFSSLALVCVSVLAGSRPCAVVHLAATRPLEFCMTRRRLAQTFSVLRLPMLAMLILLCGDYCWRPVSVFSVDRSKWEVQRGHMELCGRTEVLDHRVVDALCGTYLRRTLIFKWSTKRFGQCSFVGEQFGNEDVCCQIALGCICYLTLLLWFGWRSLQPVSSVHSI